MIPKVWLINFILAVSAVYVGKGAYIVWTQPERSNMVEPHQLRPESAVEGVQTHNPRGPVAETTYEVIAEQNLFSLDRAEYVPLEPTAEPEALKPAGKKINLYGVIIMNNTRKALMDNPVRKSHEPRQKWVGIGDSLGDLTVTAIEPENVRVIDGSDKYTIPLYTKKTRNQSPPFSDDVSGSVAPPSVVSTEDKALPSEPEVVNSGSEKQTSTPESSVKEADQGAGEYKVVNTPFGPVKRRLR